MNGSDQKAPCETLTAHAQIIAPTTAHAASGVRTPRMSPIPPSRLGDGHHQGGDRRQAPAAGLHETRGGAEVEGLDQARLDHRGTDADAKDQQAEIGG